MGVSIVRAIAIGLPLERGCMFNKIVSLLIIGCISSTSYASVLGSCSTSQFALSDLKEMSKDDLFSEYCLAQSSEDSNYKFAKQFSSLGELQRATEILAEAHMCHDNSSRIRLILANKYKYNQKTQINCERFLMKVENERLDDLQPNWKKIVKSAQFRKWLKEQPAITNFDSLSADDRSEILDQFKSNSSPNAGN